MNKLGAKISKTIIVRAITIGMHLTTTITQWIANNPKIQAKLGIKEDDKEGKDKASFIGNICAMLIHGTWNAGATAINLKLIGWLFK